MAVYYTNWSFSNSSKPNGESYTVDGVTKTYYNDVRYKFVTSEKTNILDNTSTITIKKYVCFYNNWGLTDPSRYTQDLSITMKSKIGNASYQSDTKIVFNSFSSNEYTLVGTDTFTVKHNEDGTGTTSFNGTGSYTGGSGTVYSRSVSRSGIALIDINRGSTVTSNATESTKFGDTLDFTITKLIENTNYTHELSYSLYDENEIIASDIEKTCTWQIPIDLVKASPNNAEPLITITCVTKNGTTIIGTNTYSFKCLVPEEYKPTATLELVESGDVPASWGVWVQNKSKIKGNITTGSNVAGDTATIKSYLTDSSVNKYSSNPFQTGYIVESGNYEIKTQVTDSRGRTSDYNDENTKLVAVLPYQVPTIKTLKVYRCNETGAADEEGTYARAVIDYEITSLDNHNTKTLKVSANNQSETITPTNYKGTYTFEKIFSGFDTGETYTFLFTIADYFYDNIQQSVTLSPSFITESKLAGGKGITYGRKATEEGIHSYMDVEDHGNTKVKNLNISGLKIEKYNEIFISYIEEV